MQQTCKKQIIRWNRSKPTHVEDELVVEEPLEIRVGQQSLIVVMRHRDMILNLQLVSCIPKAS